MFWRHRRPRPVDYYLIYVRNEPEGDEPLIEIVASKDEVVALEATVGRQIPNLRVLWETVPWYREQVSEGLQRTEEVFVHIAFVGMEDDPIGIAAFDDATKADAMVADHNARGVEAHRRTGVLGQWLSEEYSLSTD